MNHSFTPSDINRDICAKCKHNQLDHTALAVCEACPNIGPCELYPDVNGMLLCAVCIEREETKRNSPEAGDKRVADLRSANDLPWIVNNSKLIAAQAIDFSIQVSEQIFTAETVSINELKNTINADETIVNKQFALAELVKTRYIHFQTVIFELDEQKIAASTKQRAVQQYLNQLASTLRTEEREKLKLSDINYKPTEVKVSKPKAPSVKKFDKAELVKYANEAGIPMAALQMLCVAKGLTPQQAAEAFKKSMGSK